MSLNEYNSLRPTNYELSTNAKERRLDSAIEKLQYYYTRANRHCATIILPHDAGAMN